MEISAQGPYSLGLPNFKSPRVGENLRKRTSRIPLSSRFYS